MTYKEWQRSFVEGNKTGLQEITSDNIMKIEESKQIHTFTDGQNMIGEYTPSGDYDHMINDIVHQQGFDGKPQIVPYEEFKRKMEDSNFYAERTYSAADQTTLDSYRQELYGENGDSWYLDCSTGGSQYGQGMYCASSYDLTDNKSMGGIGWEMMHYQEVNRTQRGNLLSYTEGLTLDKTAKILELPKGATKNETYEFVVQKYVEEYVKKFSTASQKDAVIGYIKACDDISKLTFKESENVINSLYDARAVYATEIEDLIIAAHRAMEDITDGKKYHGTKDPGVLVAEMGYDAIKATSHGESGSYNVILNRTKIIFCEGGQSMAINIHTSEKVYRDLANSDQQLSDNMVEQVVSLQKKYQEHGEELDFMDFLGSEKVVKKKCEEAKEHLEKIIRKKKYENTVI